MPGAIQARSLSALPKKLIDWLQIQIVRFVDRISLPRYMWLRLLSCILLLAHVLVTFSGTVYILVEMSRTRGTVTDASKPSGALQTSTEPSLPSISVSPFPSVPTADLCEMDCNYTWSKWTSPDCSPHLAVNVSNCNGTCIWHGNLQIHLPTEKGMHCPSETHRQVKHREFPCSVPMEDLPLEVAQSCYDTNERYRVVFATWNVSWIHELFSSHLDYFNMAGMVVQFLKGNGTKVDYLDLTPCEDQRSTTPVENVCTTPLEPTTY